jgi:hypothetical protein
VGFKVPVMWLPCAVTVIQNMVYRLVFLFIQGGVIMTTNNQLTVVGSPTLVAGPVGGLGVLLNGVGQYFELPTSPSCLVDPSTCNYGLNMKFNLKVLDFNHEVEC